MSTKIIIKTDDLIQVLEEVTEAEQKAIELEIDGNVLRLATLEAGGTGYCADYDEIEAMTEEEIEELP